MRVLVVEDNRNIAESIGDYLSLYDHVVEYAFNGEMALNILEGGEFDVVIMDGLYSMIMNMIKRFVACYYWVPSKATKV